MDSSFLIVTGASTDSPRLHFVKSESARERILDEHLDYRISSVFPSKPESIDGFETKNKFQIVFFAVDDPLDAISSVLQQLDSEFGEKVWFGVGLASLILIDVSDGELEEVKRILGDGLHAHEKWSIDGQDIVSQVVEISDAIEVDSSDFRVRNDDEHLDSATVFLLNDIQYGIDNLVGLATSFSRGLLPTLKRLSVETGDIVNEVQSHYRLLFSMSDDQLLEKREIQEQINAGIDHLVQINSVLAYAMSQSFGGSFPILSNRCLVHSHSLLGIGFATQTLYRVCEFVDNAFKKFPIENIVGGDFAIASAFPPFKSLNNVELSDWDSQLQTFDQMIVNATDSEESPRPHIMFFSGRLGFQEAAHAISAALQAVEFCSATSWSLMILSHELMHAHVRSLLTELFSSKSEEVSSKQTFEEAAQHYCQFQLGKHEPENLLESIRFSIFNFCRFRESADRSIASGQKKGTFTQSAPTAARIGELVKFYWMEINEVLVHTLDYKYFYFSDFDLYVTYLWKSWSTVPSVLANPEHYLLRTIALVSTSSDGSLVDKGRQAIGKIAVKLNQLSAEEPNNILLQHVKAILSDPEMVNPLLLKALPYQYLAEMASKCLFSSAISTELFRDEFVEAEGEAINYNVTTGDFTGAKVTSPIALLVDRIRRILNQPALEGKLSEQYRAAWLFLACGSIRKG